MNTRGQNIKKYILWKFRNQANYLVNVKRIWEGTALAPTHSVIGLKKFALAYQPIRRDSVVQIFPPWRKLDVFTLNSRGLLAIWTVVLLGSCYFFGIGFYEIKKITWFVSCWLGKHEPVPVLFTKNIFVKLDFRIAATNCLKCFNIYIFLQIQRRIL